MPTFSRPQDVNIQNDWEFQFLGLSELPKVIGLTGPTKSGKSIITKRLTTEHGYHFIGLGTMLQKITEELGRDPTKWHELGITGMHLRQLKGQDILAKMAFEKIRQLTPIHNKFVVDSLLHPAEMKFLEGRCDFVPIGVIATQQARVDNLVRWFEMTETQARDFLKLRDDFEQYRHHRKDPYAPNIDKCLGMISDESWIIQVGGEMTAESIHIPVDLIIKKLFQHWSFN